MTAVVAPRLAPAPRAATFATVALAHAVLAAAILLVPSVRERIVAAQPLLVEYRGEARAEPAPPKELPGPRMRDPIEIALPVPPIAIAPDVAIQPPASHAPSISLPAAAPIRIAEATPAIEPPRFDMSYLNNPAPAYPPVSRRLKEQGRVLLRVFVSASGSAEDVEVRASSGSDRLDRAAIDAVRHWRFAPARRGNETIAAWAIVPILFQLDT